MKIKDRVKLNRNDKYIKDGKGTVVKLQYRNNELKTACILWDKDWPHPNDDRSPRLFYYKPSDLRIVDTWRM